MVEKFYFYFSSHRSNPASKLLCVVLHSMSSDHQRALAMQSAEPNVHKIILATTIAESSITVPDVKYGRFCPNSHFNLKYSFFFFTVIDFCLIRTLVTDRSTNFTSLQLNWTARNNCEQRMGRAGRVMDGRCYRFVTKYFYEVRKTLRIVAASKNLNLYLEFNAGNIVAGTHSRST